MWYSIHHMASKNPRNLDDMEFSIYIDEAIRIICDVGDPSRALDNIKSEFHWHKSDVLQLLQHPTFLQRFRDTDEGVFDAFQFAQEDVDIASARQKARAKMDEYIDVLDDIARNGSNENAKLSAAMKLLDIGGATSENYVEEVISLPKGFEEKVAQRVMEVYNQPRTLKPSAKRKT